MEKLKLIDRITDIIKLNGGFSVGEFDDDTNGVVVSELGKFVGIAEYFNEDCATINIYEPTSFSSDEVDNFEMKYEEMDDNVLQEILLICEKWDKKWGEEYKNETLEEAAEKFYPPKTTDLICSPKLVRDSFIAGAKWQQEQNKNLHSKEDLLNFGAFVRIEDKKEKRLFLIQDYFKKWKQIKKEINGRSKKTRNGKSFLSL